MRTLPKKAKYKAALVAAELLILILLAVVLFVVIKLSKIEKNRLNADELAINNDLSDETMDVMADYQTIALFGLDNRSNGNLSKGRSDVVIPCDLASNVTTLHEFLFDTTDYVPSTKVQENSSYIINKTGYRQGDGS